MALPPPPPVAIIAHRGASGHAPEHTFAAYDRAVAMGADYLEQDLHVTADGHLVVLHDDTLDRTTDGSGRVEEHTLADVRALDAGAWFAPEFAGERVPTLDAVLARYGHGQRYYIETKAPDIEERLVALLDRHGLLDAGRWQVLIQSFEPTHLRRIRELEPRLPLIQLVGLRDPSLLDHLDEISAYAAGIGPSRALLDARILAAAHARGLAVHPYTYETDEDHAAAVALGVDGAFTNFPDRFATVLGRVREAPDAGRGRAT
jgi:glycerophosphoryl diester phosphodiesterase